MPQLPYEPIFTIGIGLNATFGAPKKPVTPVHKNPLGDQKIVVEHFAAVSGLVADDTGAPVVGAKVTITVKDKIGDALTADKGAFRVEKLPIDNARIDVTLDGEAGLGDARPPRERQRRVPKIVLEAVLPPGQAARRRPQPGDRQARRRRDDQRSRRVTPRSPRAPTVASKSTSRRVSTR